MADDAYDDDLFDDVYAGDVSSAPAPPPQPLKTEVSEARLDDSPYSRRSVAQEASYAPDTNNHIASVDTGNDGRAGGAFDGHAVKTEHFQDEEHQNGDDGYPPIGIKEDG